MVTTTAVAEFPEFPPSWEPLRLKWTASTDCDVPAKRPGEPTAIVRSGRSPCTLARLVAVNVVSTASSVAPVLVRG